MEIQKHDKELADKLYEKHQPTAEPDKQTNTDQGYSQVQQRRELVMTTLWQRMGEIFGNQWELNFGAAGGSAYQTWTSGLADYSEEQIRNGVEQCRKWTSSFIPHMGQFIELCTVKRTDKPNFTDLRIAEEKRTGAGLDGMIEHLSKHALSETAKRELDRMRRIIAGEDIESFEESMTNLGLHRRWQ